MSELQFLLLLIVVHVLGLVAVAVLMIPALRTDEPGFDDESDGGSDDGWGNRPNSAPSPSRWPGGGLPLPDAEQSDVRLREPGRIRERLPLPSRRPKHDPQPVRKPVRS